MTAAVVERIPSPVHRLLAWRRPPAVAGFVVAIVVDAIDRMIGRTRTHVREEGFVRFRPAFAHGNPASTVPRIALGRRSAAAIEQRAPDAIFTRPVPASGVAVCQGFNGPNLAAQAAATVGPAVLQTGGSRSVVAPAGASTLPENRQDADRCESFDGRQPAEADAWNEPIRIGTHTQIISASHPEACEGEPDVEPAK